MSRRRRVLLGQLGANGDCVYATTVARQIKADDPECHLTWAIGSSCRQVIAHNPHVDEVWEIDYRRRDEMARTWTAFEGQARQRQARGDFDDVYLTQIYPNNFQNYDGTVRASIFRGYPRPITVPVTPVIRLSEADIERVTRFAAAHGLTKGGRAVMFESAPGSGQSPMTTDWAYAMARQLLVAVPGTKVIMTSGVDATRDNAAIINAGELGFRDVAELSRYCGLFVGCSSGLTWLLTSDAAAAQVPTIQVLTRSVGYYGAVVHDLEHWKLPSDHVIELHDCSPELAAECATEVLTQGVAHARPKFHEPTSPDFRYYFKTMLPVLRRGHVGVFVDAMAVTIARYGLRGPLVRDLLSEASSMVLARALRRAGRSVVS